MQFCVILDLNYRGVLSRKLAVKDVFVGRIAMQFEFYCTRKKYKLLMRLHNFTGICNKGIAQKQETLRMEKNVIKEMRQTFFIHFKFKNAYDV